MVLERLYELIGEFVTKSKIKQIVSFAGLKFDAQGKVPFMNMISPNSGSNKERNVQYLTTNEDFSKKFEGQGYTVADNMHYSGISSFFLREVQFADESDPGVTIISGKYSDIDAWAIICTVNSLSAILPNFRVNIPTVVPKELMTKIVFGERRVEPGSDAVSRFYV